VVQKRNDKLENILAIGFPLTELQKEHDDILGEFRRCRSTMGPSQVPGANLAKGLAQKCSMHLSGLFTDFRAAQEKWNLDVVLTELYEQSPKLKEGIETLKGYLNKKGFACEKWQLP
jgi:hypothetical protein